MTEFEQLINDNSSSPQMPYWGNNKQSSYKEIVLKQIESCRVEGSKQMAGESSFYQKDNQGNFYMVHVYDQKKIYIQCIKSLYDLMMRYFDDKFNEAMELIESERNGLADKYIKLYIQREPLEHLKKLALQTQTIQKNAIGSRILSELEEARFEIYRRIYQELLLLFDRKNELSGKKTISAY